jgi:hypothetical protein
MSTFQTMITLLAFTLLMTILVSFYRLLGQSGDTIGNAQQGISEQTLVTTYTELANGLYFDEFSLDSNITPSEINTLTSPTKLGPDNPPPTGEATEADLKTFDDFDDLNNFDIVVSSMPGVIGSYKTHFDVYYVNPTDVNTKVTTSRTFIKRLDMKICRLYPPSKDTLKTSIIMGYFHFD